MASEGWFLFLSGLLILACVGYQIWLLWRAWEARRLIVDARLDYLLRRIEQLEGRMGVTHVRNASDTGWQRVRSHVADEEAN